MIKMNDSVWHAVQRGDVAATCKFLSDGIPASLEYEHGNTVLHD
jgi:hypothetical protein